MVSFLHAADLHLGLRITRLEPDTAKRVREARFRALDGLLKAGADRQVDFLLIAGDLFDDHAVDQVTARRAFMILEDAPMPIYVLSGNHDPFLPGAVWDRSPWNQPQPARVHLLRQEELVPVRPDVVLLPCPVFRKTSLRDPTAWIAQVPNAAGMIRIGVAHGSLRIRDDLPADDHLIDRHAAQKLQLDYLALGHWHRRQLFADPDGVARTAYSGVHEPMRFPVSADGHTGWKAYGGDREEFRDGGKGEALHIRIRGPGVPPEIEPVEVGHLVWQEEQRSLTSEDDLSLLIKTVATRATPEVRLLRLKLSGVLDAQAMLRLEELREILAGSYLLGELDTSELHLQPTEEQIRAVAGEGILRRVLEKLQEEATHSEPTVRQVADRALLLLYQIAQEAKA
jgi:DNA repair exonuclease SbcCD nuclease subunit